MANDQIVAGDLVRLKSGGPLMTVEGTDGKLAKCSWFDWSETYWSVVFSVKALAKE